MLHVITDVVGIRLCVFLPLVETSLSAAVRAGVVNRLALPEQLDGAVDVLRLWRLRPKRADGGKRQARQENDRYFTAHH
jgi:hypothetical protein